MGLPRKVTEFFRSVMNKTNSFTEYYDLLKQIFVVSFEWENMPEEIDEMYFERMLFERGAVCFFRDDEAGKYAVLPCTMTNRWNIYDIPIYRRVFATNSYNKDVDASDSVIIFNNALRTPSERLVTQYANRLAEYDQTIDVNIHAQKTPVLIRCDEKERLSLKNLYMQYEGNIPVIFGDRNLSATPLEAIQTNAPFVADSIYDMKVSFWNELLTYAGISNLNIQKKERLITDEVQRMMGGILACRNSRLLARQRACQEINKMFGLNISVKFRDDIDITNTDGITPEETEMVKEGVADE